MISVFGGIGRFLGIALVGFLLTNQAAALRHIPAEEFGKLPIISGMSLSPDGKYIVYLQPRDGKYVVVSRSLEDPSAAPYVTDFDELDARAAVWVSDEYYVVIATQASKLIAGGTDYRTMDSRMVAVHRSGATTPKIMLAADAGPDVVTGSKGNWKVNQGSFFHPLPNDQRHFLAFWEGGVVKVNIRNGEPKTVFEPKGWGVYSAYPDLDGKVRLYVNRQGKTFWIDEKGFEREITVFDVDVDEGEGIGDLVFERDPRFGYAVIQDDRDDKAIAVKVDFKQNKILGTVLAHPLVDVGGFSASSLLREVIGVNYYVDQRQIHYLNEDWAQRQRTLDAAFNNLAPRAFSPSRDKSKFLVYTESPYVPSSYYLYNEKQNTATFLGSAYPQFETGELADVFPIKYFARDGQEIRGYLTVPVGQQPKNLPMVTMPHGGPQARDGQSFDYLAQFLANRGFAVFQPNFRGSGGYGKKWAEAGHGEWGGLMSDDVTDGVRKLVELGVADPKRMCIMGWSYGGYAAQIAAVVTPDLYNCAISINGVSDLPDMLDEETKGNIDAFYTSRDYWTEHMGHRYKDRKALIAASPARQTARIKMPILLIHAETDRIVPVEQSRKMAEMLRNAGKPVTYVEFPGGDHSLTYEKSRVTAMQEVDKFLAIYMNP